MPRVCNWKDLRFYKAEKGGRYKHIDRLFSDVIDWQLIRSHWKDLMQVAIRHPHRSRVRSATATPRG